MRTIDYDKQWKEVDSLMHANLNKSALYKITKVYDYALVKKDYAQAVKAIIYRFGNRKWLNEDMQAIIDSLKHEVQQLPQPAKSVGYAIIANEYRRYYFSDRRVRNRTRAAVDDSDIKTWDITRLFEEALKYHKLSIQDETVLQQTPLDDYRAIVEYVQDTTLQKIVFPALYDFLAFNAIEAFRSETSVVLPQQTFVLDKPEYFADIKTFVDYKIETPDSLSAEYNVIGMFQKLLKFRLQDGGNKAALVSLDIERLKYVSGKGKYEDRDALYENALKSQMDKYSQSDEWAYPALALAVLYEKQGYEEQKNNRYRYKESYDLCSKIISLYGGKAGMKAIVEAAKMLQEKIACPFVNLTCKQLHYPDSPILALVKYKNAGTLRLKIYKTSEDYLSGRYNAKIEDFDNKKPFATKEINLPLWDDYREHSTEIMIDGLPQGCYVIFPENTLGLSANNRTFAVFQVSALDATFRAGIEDAGYMMQIYVANAKTGEPAKNANIEYFTHNNVNTGTTGNNGIAYIPDINRNERIEKIAVSNGNERLVINARHYYRPFDSSDENRKTVCFFTDRSIYRPGQTVYYKALYLEKNERKYALLKNKTVDINFYDVNGKAISTQKHTTNEYGSIQGSFAVPQGLLNGTMTLSSKYGTQRIRVEEYKRPTFEVKIDAPAKNCRLNDSVRIAGKANAYAGYAVDNAKVQYRVVRDVEYRIHRWWLPYINRPSREIASGVINTDNEGRFVIDFKAEAGDIIDDNLIYLYKVTADVTDSNGETRSDELSVRIGKKPLLVETSIPDNIIDRDSLDFTVRTTNLNDNFTPAGLQVTIVSLKSPDEILHERLWEVPDTFVMSRAEFKRHFPHDPYDDEDVYQKYSEEKQIVSYQTRTTPESGRISLRALADAPAGWYRVDIKAKNDDGTEVELQEFVQLKGNPVAKPSKTPVPSPVKNMSGWLTVVKNSGEPGDSAEFWVGGGEQKSYIHYEIVHKNCVVERRSIIAGINPERIVIPVKEEYRGGFTALFLMIQNGRTYTKSCNINVPFTNKQLDINFITFRDKLLPGEREKWTLNIKNKKGEKETAEMIATLYDASLDVFAPHSWNYTFYKQYSLYYDWVSYTKEILNFGFFKNYYYHTDYDIFSYPYLIDIFGGNDFVLVKLASKSLRSANILEEEEIAFGVAGDMFQETDAKEKDASGGKAALTDIATRQNFNETAFFYPQLRTDENGEISIEFTVPEALTRWKMLGFAHTGDFKTGYITNELTTQKQVAVSVNVPRFFRENDTVELTAKVNNITENDLTGQAMLRLYDAVTMQPVDATIIRSPQTQPFAVKAGLSAGLKWTLVIPASVQAISYKVTAQAGNHTDGEEKTVPVLKNSMLVTETMPFSIRAGEQKSLTFDNLKDNKSTTLRNHRLTLEFTSNPAWYAIQAMPYLMEYPYECSEQTFSRFYANSLATTIVNSSLRIKQIFDLWRNLPENKDALLSNLEKNQELKQVLLEETPWVMQAQNETERKKRAGLLFDLNRMSAEQQRAFDKVQKAQQGDGGFPWFTGCPSSYFITSHIISGLEHLDRLNALGDFKNRAQTVINKGLQFMDKEVQESYDELSKSKTDMSKQTVGYSEIKYLYTCSFSKHKPQDTKAFDYYYAQSKQYWTKFNLYAQAMTALALNRFGDAKTARDIIRSLKERAQQSEEMGMYWKSNVPGYFWYQAPVETQAMLIEAFNEAGDDKQSVEEMKIWLLRNKQTNDWRTTKATAEACYALLMTGGNLLDENQTLEVAIGGKPLSEAAKEDIRPESGTGYVKTAWTGANINQNMANIAVANPNKSGIAWGGMYWQYFEQLDKITSAETALKMNKQLFLKKTAGRGEELHPLDESSVLKTGDVLTVRMTLRADRDYEFVHLKDMRAAALEPVKAVSGYRYQDGLWYYECIKDASMNFFITYLRKGTYVFEYDLRVTHAGQFSNGITTFQCMYAPEFSTHSEGVRIKAE
jgi:uncharacterized protein YfaS (alpha-2-macroglobulin family)